MKENLQIEGEFFIPPFKDSTRKTTCLSDVYIRIKFSAEISLNS